MLTKLRSLGFDTIVTTPHVTDAPSPEYHELMQSAFAVMAREAAHCGVSLIQGYEVMLSPRTAQILEDGAPLAIGVSHSVLVEVSLAGWPAFADQVLFDLQLAGYTPILAHPERYKTIIDNPEKGIELARRGIALQVTTSAFAGLFGREVQHAAEALLLSEAVTILGTDAHGAGQRVEKAVAGMERVEELVGPARAQQLLRDNMLALLTNRPLPVPAPQEPNPRRRRGLLSRIR